MSHDEDRLSRIEGALEDLAQAHADLAQEQITAALTLTNAINNLALKIDSVRDAVPLKVVAWMFAIVVATVSGIQGSQWFFQTYLKP